ncbi:MAG: C40 family peptidase [Proteobacteria bacterium]|nr:C40 family peptidase [Pseudomonadota bacterium]
MTAFFSSPSSQALLKAELDSWLGTPYRHWCGVKGKGADCIHFVLRVYQALGLVQWRRGLVPEYPADWHLHNTGELLLDGVVRELNVEPVDPDSPQNGDLVLFRFGKAVSHAAIYFEGGLYQSMTGYGVRRLSWKDAVWFKRRTHVFRLVGPKT